MNFDYRTVNLGSLGVVTTDDITQRRTTRESGSFQSGGKIITAIRIGDEVAEPTARFWESLLARFNISRSVFKFFTVEEVLQRIAQQETDPMIRICLERNDNGSARILAVTGTNKPILYYDDLAEIVAEYGHQDLKYSNGIVTTTHDPVVPSEFNIGGDKFKNKFVLHAPIDGYGQPNFFLSMLRLICSNGAVGYAESFRTTLKLGSGSDNVAFMLRRALDSFTNDEGYAIMRQRFEAAINSYASVREQQDLYRLLLGLQGLPELQKTEEDDPLKLGAKILGAYEKLTGSPYEMYARDPSVMSTKRQSALPVKASVYDLFNFATEVATHKVQEFAARKLQAWLGSMLSNDYDLEGSGDQYSEFRPIHMK